MQHIPGPASITLGVKAPLILPFLSDRYIQSEAFSFDPFQIAIGRCSGSPVILSDRVFAGFLKDAGGVFTYDGSGILSIEIPADQELLLAEEREPEAGWDEYNEILAGAVSPVENPFSHLPEYSTWAEQKQSSEFGSPLQVNNVPFVRDYVERVLAMGFPPGKLVIDAGWCFPHGEGGFGDWKEDICQFPDLPILIEFLQEQRFTPGLWLAPSLISPLSRLISEHPELAFDETRCQIEGIEDNRFLWAVPGEALKDHFKSVFSYFLDMGFHKFKLDLFFGPRQRMKEILRCAYEAITEQDPAVEVDCHIPDLFISRYCHAVRPSDLLSELETNPQDRQRRWWVCRKSSPDKLIYLDPIGGNSPEITEEIYRQHLAIYLHEEGMPVISLLPDRFGEEAVKETRDLLERRFS